MKTRSFDESLSIVPTDQLNLIIPESLSSFELRIVSTALILRVFRDSIQDFNWKHLKLLKKSLPMEPPKIRNSFCGVWKEEMFFLKEKHFLSESLTHEVIMKDEKCYTQITSLKTEYKEWLTSDEAATYLGVSTAHLMNLTSSGKVPYYKFGRSNRYLLSELRDLLMSHPKGERYGN